MEGKKETSKPRNVALSNYLFSNDDFLALNKLITLTHSFTLDVASERGMGNYKKFSIFAPGKNNTWYRGEGPSIVQAIENWIKETTKPHKYD
jgi:hypothetical protein